MDGSEPVPGEIRQSHGTGLAFSTYFWSVWIPKAFQTVA